MREKDKKMASIVINDFKSDSPTITENVKRQSVASLRTIAICYSMEASVAQLDLCRGFVEEAIGAELDRFQAYLLFLSHPHTFAAVKNFGFDTVAKDMLVDDVCRLCCGFDYPDLDEWREFHEVLRGQLKEIFSGVSDLDAMYKERNGYFFKKPEFR